MSEQVEAGRPGEQGAAGADTTTRIDDTGAVYRRIRPDEHEAVNELIALGFGRPGATSFAMEVTRPESFRVIEADGELVAALDKNDLGQFWLGRRMPSTQICRVATVPHGGGRGYAGALMTGYLHELHETGTPTATLFASTLALYRAAGFECAGDWTEYSLRAEHLPRRTAPYRADRVPLDDLDEIRALYKVIAPTRHGALDRDEAWWRWLIGRDRGSTVAFVLRDPDGAAAGWAIVGFGSEEGWRVRARVIDWGCLPGAERALYGVLGSYGPLDGVVTWSGPDPDPSLFVLPDRQFGHYGPETRDHWLLRLVDVRRALELRAYPELVSGSVRFSVDDERCPWNTGSWELEIADGKGRVTPAADAPVTASVRALGPLFTGFLGPEELVRAGLLTGAGAPDLAFLRAAFTTHRPWSAEHY
jgi:predicted acetyltransferase